MAFDNSTRIINNGTKIKQEIKVDNFADQFKDVFSNPVVDLKSKGITTLKGLGPKSSVFKTTTDYNEGKKGPSINKQMVHVIQQLGVYGLHKNTPITNTAINGFTFQSQTETRTSTIDAAVKAWTHLGDLKSKKDGALFVFDLETFGAKTKDKRWAPAGITEFAMVKTDFATGESTNTNILMTNKSTMKRLEDYYTKYKKYMNEGGGGIQALRNDEDVYVFAMRMSLYDPKSGATFKKEGGAWQATNLPETESAKPGSIDVVTRAMEQFRTMSKDTDKDPVTGLSMDQHMLVMRSGEMSAYLKNNRGIAAGHNILAFDRGILDKEIRDIYNSQLDIINNPKASKEDKLLAEKAISMYGVLFGDSIGFNFRKGNVLDTFPLGKAGHDEFGIATPNLQLSTLGKVFYPNKAAEGVAHLGIHDVMVNTSLILDIAEAGNTNGKSYVDWIMQDYLIPLQEKNKPIEIKSNQVYMATGSPMSSSYSGRDFMNYREYRNGEIHTNGSFIVKNGKVEFSEYTGNTGLDKGGYYTISNSSVIKTKDLDPAQVRKLQESYPEFNNSEWYHAELSSHTRTTYATPHKVHIFAPTQEELEAKLASNLVHVANINESGYEPVKAGLDYVNGRMLNLDDRYETIITKSNFTDEFKNAMNRTERKRANEASNRSVFTGKDSLKRIEGILSFEREARKAGLGDSLDLIAKNEVPLISVLKKNGVVDGVTYFNEKQMQQLDIIYKRNLGYKFDNEWRINPGTLNNTATAYERVMSQKDYYTNVIKTVKGHFNTDTVTGDNKDLMNEYFIQLDRNLTVNALQNRGYGDDKIKRIVTRTADSSIRETAYYKNNWDFALGNKFARVGTTTQTIENTFALAQKGDNVVSLNPFENGAGAKFMNKLLAMRLGDDVHNSRDTTLEANKAAAVYDFLMDLHYNGDRQGLYDYAPFRKYVTGLVSNHKATNTAPKDFDPGVAMSHFIEAARRAKEADPFVGLGNLIGNVNVTAVDTHVAGILNNISPDIMVDTSKDIKVIKTYNSKNKKTAVNNLVQVFGISDAMYEESIAGAGTAEMRTKRLIKNIGNEQMTTFMDDLLTTASQHDILVHVDETNRRLFLEKNGKTTELTKIPKFFVGGDKSIRLLSGGSDVNLGLEMVPIETKNGTLYRVSTNLDRRFGRKKFFEDMMDNILQSNGTIDLSQFNISIGASTKDSYEMTSHSGLKTDIFTANRRLDISATLTEVGNMIRPNGPYNSKLQEMDFADPHLISKLLPHLDRIMKAKEDGNDMLPPDIQMLLQPDAINIARAMTDPNDPHYDELMYIFSQAGASNKETSLVKGHVQIGKRVIGTTSNELDNVQRPPMTGAGNVKKLRVNELQALKKFGVLPGSIVESNDNLGLIWDTSVPGLDVVSDFMASQVYMSGATINRQMKKQEDIIMAADIDNATIKGMTEKKKRNVYHKMIETMSSGTYEQSRIGDPRVMDALLNMPIDTQELSLSKDVMGAITKEDDEQFRKLIGLIGNISVNEDGTYKYSRDRSGTIVKKGEAVVKYKSYGDVERYFGSKHETGVLSFAMTSANKVTLTDKEITRILNQYSEQFDVLDPNNPKDQRKMMRQLIDILEANHIKSTFRIENANQASLFKIQDAGTEKGMTLGLKATLGQYNENVLGYFNTLVPESDSKRRRFLNGMIPTEQAIRALHEDIAQEAGITVNELIAQTNKAYGGTYDFSNMSKIMGLVKDERYVYAEMGFGKFGVFNGYSFVANDNIPKHDNAGLATFSQFGGAIQRLSRVNGKSYEENVADIVKAMNENDDINFIRRVDNGKIGGGFNLTTNGYGTLLFDKGEDEEWGVDNKRFTNFFEYANDLIIKLDAEAADNERLVHEDVWRRDKSGKLIPEKKMIGNLLIEKQIIDGEEKRVVIGSESYIGHAVIADSETVSGVTQNYIEAKTTINELQRKSKLGQLTELEEQELIKLREFVGSQSDFASFVKADDQLLTILSAQRFDTDLEERLTYSLADKNSDITRDKVAFLSKRTNGAIKVDSRGKVTLSEDMKGAGAFDAWAEQVKQWQFFNPVKDIELTPELLNTDEYRHLSKVYADMKSYGADKVGSESAQNFYDLRNMNKAAEFNTNPYSKEAVQEMVDKNGFEMLKLEDYVSTRKSANGGPIESIRDKNIILDLGDDFSNDQRYLAIPAGGQVIKDNEVLSEPQRRVDQLKKQQEAIVNLMGGGDYGGRTYEDWLRTPADERDALKKKSLENEQTRKKYENAVSKMVEIRQEIVDATNEYNQKGGAFTEATKIEIPAVANRAKVLSITSTNVTNEALEAMGITDVKVAEDSAEFMSKARVMMPDGTSMSLAELDKNGIKYDFERVGIEEFEKMDMFSDKTLAEYGFDTKEQMIEHLQTYGDADIAIRYPTIMQNSAFVSIKYLDPTMNGNFKSVSSYSMLKYNGDSDGDSESSVQARMKNVSYSLLQRKRQIAAAELTNEGLEATADAVRERMLQDGLNPEALEGWEKMQMGMDLRATLTNPSYSNRVLEDMIGDIANNIKVGVVGDINKQIKDAESDTFKNFRMSALSVFPSGAEIEENAVKVQEIVAKSLQRNPEVFGGEDMRALATEIANGTKSIRDVQGTDKYKVLDKAMLALEKDAVISEEELSAAKQVMFNRVRISQALEEGQAKSTKSVIGSVNIALNATKEVSNWAFNMEKSKYYDPDKYNIFYNMAYQIEQNSVISGKKVSFEVGDERVVNLESILSRASGGEVGETILEDFTEWLTRFAPESSTDATWDSMNPKNQSAALNKVKQYASTYNKLNDTGLSEAELLVRAKNRHFAEEMINSIGTINSDKDLKAMLSNIKANGMMNSTFTGASKNKDIAPNFTLASTASNLIREVSAEDVEKVAERLTKSTSDNIDMRLKETLDFLTDKVPTPPPSDNDMLNIDANHLVSDEKIKKALEREAATSELLTKAPKFGIGSGIGTLALGVAAGLMVAGYAGGGHQRPTKPQDDTQPTQTPMLEDNDNLDNGMRQQGYVININADTDKGARHLKKTLKDVARASNANGSVNINMNYRTTSGGGYSNKDIENIINNFM